MVSVSTAVFFRSAVWLPARIVANIAVMTLRSLLAPCNETPSLGGIILILCLSIWSD